jgi:hypothetical protein
VNEIYVFKKNIIMNGSKAIISALLVFVVQGILILPSLINGTYPLSSLWPGLDLLNGVVIFLALLASAYLVSRKYYFRDSKIDEPVGEGLLLGIFISIIMGVYLLIGYYLGPYSSSFFLGASIMVGVGLIPAVTTIAALDAKAAKKKRFWFF